MSRRWLERRSSSAAHHELHHHVLPLQNPCVSSTACSSGDASTMRHPSLSTATEVPRDDALAGGGSELVNPHNPVQICLKFRLDHVAVHRNVYRHRSPAPSRTIP